MSRAFWIYPEPDNKYWRYRVHVLKTRRGLQRVWNRDREPDDYLMGFCETYKGVWEYRGKNKKGKKTGIIGAIVMNEEDLNVEVISHECAHAAFGYCEHKRSKKYHKHAGGNAHEDQETYCYAQGRMTDQVIRWALRNGFKFRKAKK